MAGFWFWSNEFKISISDKILPAMHHKKTPSGPFPSLDGVNIERRAVYFLLGKRS